MLRTIRRNNVFDFGKAHICAVAGNQAGYTIAASPWTALTGDIEHDDATGQDLAKSDSADVAVRLLDGMHQTSIGGVRLGGQRWRVLRTHLQPVSLNAVRRYSEIASV